MFYIEKYMPFRYGINTMEINAINMGGKRGKQAKNNKFQSNEIRTSRSTVIHSALSAHFTKNSTLICVFVQSCVCVCAIATFCSLPICTLENYTFLLLKSMST